MLSWMVFSRLYWTYHALVSRPKISLRSAFALTAAGTCGRRPLNTSQQPRHQAFMPLGCTWCRASKGKNMARVMGGTSEALSPWLPSCLQGHSLLSLWKQAAMLWAALQRGPRGRECLQPILNEWAWKRIFGTLPTVTRVYWEGAIPRPAPSRPELSVALANIPWLQTCQGPWARDSAKDA